MAGASAGTGEVKEVAISRANVAAQIMEHLCTCPLHGYSQPGRHGTSGHCSVPTDTGTIRVTKGDRDCSSAVCEAWELALVGTAYDGLITRYNWTGGMREMFVGSGLFSWEPMSFNASRGDIYLDEENHTAMCIRNDGTADLLGEFSISETGGIDGEPGDQTGRESWVHDYYSGSWDGILHYNGKADVGGSPGGSGSGAPSGDVSELAERVIAGEFGNGDARKAALGSRYDEVQAEVNRILLGGGSGIDVDATRMTVSPQVSIASPTSTSKALFFLNGLNQCSFENEYVPRVGIVAMLDKQCLNVYDMQRSRIAERIGCTNTVFYPLRRGGPDAEVYVRAAPLWGS